MKTIERWWPGMLPLLVGSLGITACASAQTPDVPTAPAVVETDPVPGRGDSGDDVAIWIHPSDPSRSVVIGTDSGNGVGVYDLSGAELAFHEDGATGMVDVRYDLPLMTFAISGSDSVDAVQSDDSMEITNVPLGSVFPDGLVVVEDGDNTAPGNEGSDNYKLVRWGDIAALHSPALTVDSSWDPRRRGDG